MVALTSASRWFVVQTQAHHEMKAAAHLQRQGYTVYVPKYLKRRRHARRVETVPRPLFPRYLFVAADRAQPWRPIQSTVGVTRLVCNGDSPASISQSVIAEIKAREDRNGFISLRQAGRFVAGDTVRVIEGIFASCQAFFECVMDDQRVAILLKLLGRNVRVVVDDCLVASA